MTRTEIQEKAYEDWVNMPVSKGTFVAGTGLGKTRVIAMAIGETLKADPNANAIVLTPLIDLKDQTKEEFKKWGYGDVLDRVEFECIQTAYEWSDRHYTVVAADEVHLMLTPEYFRFFEANTYEKLFCCTATVPTQPLKSLLLQSIAPVYYTFSLDQSVKAEFVAPYDIYCTPIKLTSEEDKEYKQIQRNYTYYKGLLGDWEAFQNSKDIFDEADWFTALPEAEQKEMKKNAFIFMGLVRKRKTFLMGVKAKKLLTHTVATVYEPDASIFLFNGTNKISDEIIKGLPKAKSYHSGMTKSVRKSRLEDFKKGKIRILSTTMAANTGISVDVASVGILNGINSSEITMVQRVGRLLRKEEGKRAKIIIPYLVDSQEEKWIAKATGKLANVKFVKNLKAIYEDSEDESGTGKTAGDA